jgi:hypothetical protein
MMKKNSGATSSIIERSFVGIVYFVGGYKKKFWRTIKANRRGKLVLQIFITNELYIGFNKCSTGEKNSSMQSHNPQSQQC